MLDGERLEEEFLQQTRRARSVPARAEPRDDFGIVPNRQTAEAQVPTIAGNAHHLSPLMASSYQQLTQSGKGLPNI
jgi:hypothetical protein